MDCDSNHHGGLPCVSHLVLAWSDCQMKPMDERIDWAIMQTWNAIAADAGRVTVVEAAELVYDADRMEMYARDKEAVQAFREKTHEEQEAAAISTLSRFV